MLKDKRRAQNIFKSKFARKRRKILKEIRLERMLNLFRKNRKLRKSK